MLIIDCPYCGKRNELEFSYGGEAHIKRPEDPSKLSDKEWADYVFMNSNNKGQYKELWYHVAGCRKWFNAERDTVTYKINRCYKIGEK